MTTPDPVGELIERLRDEDKCQRAIQMVDETPAGEAADALSALQGQVRELEVNLIEQGKEWKRVAHADEAKRLEIATLRDALTRLQSAGSELESFMGKLHLMDDETILGSDLVANGLNDRLDELRTALAREHPDIGTPEKEENDG